MAPPARALGEVNELVAIILAFLDNRSLARAACVCRRWSEIALGVLWREVDDLHRLFSMLCPFAKPMKKMGEGSRMLQSFKFKRDIYKKDWQRFSRYSTHVRRLVFDERSPKYRTKVLDNSVFFMSTTRKIVRGGILPNLQTIVWHVHTPDTQLQSLSLMHRGLRELDVQILPPGSYSTTAIDFVYQISQWAPNLTHLTLRRRGPVRELEEDICRLLENLLKLQKVDIPLCGSTNSIMEELSRLEDLREVALAGPDEGGMGDPMDVLGFSPELQEDAFPVLRRMSFSARIPAATRFLQSPFFPERLTRLHVHAVDVVDPDVLETFFSTVARNCPEMVELTVDFILCPDVSLVVPAPPMDARPSIATFRPLFACRRITSFEFRWDYALCLQDHDMEEFALAWPGLEHFMLNSSAVIEFTPSPLTLGALIPFARHCLRLRHLGLYINADARPSRAVEQPFRSLEKLSVGASNIAAADSVALFLSQLCTPVCEIVAGLRWPDAYGLALDNAGIFDERRTMICDSWVRWNEVVKVLPVVIKARREERGRVAFLQHGI
ncbi:hypothetical protein EVJ58_g5568 [Rhodofomes roseus]|uniref:F-box domain-containing protein n=1 Tax=Rhodofomes roseus TaxID=34475 RepID=A0A4Y9YBS2_9APHY|nr:hypothetical protein EVJ58_g5568 [Rhodofomes roseus]